MAAYILLREHEKERLFLRKQIPGTQILICQVFQ